MQNPAIPGRLPANSIDRLVACMSYATDLMIQLELVFDRALDAPRLARALDLTMDAEPMLGCRFVHGPLAPHWQRLAAADRPALLVTDDPAQLDAFRDRIIDATAGAQIQACLLRESSGDRFLLKVSHEAADAGGVKHIASIVSGIYRNLAADPNYIPTPNVNGDRGPDQIMAHIPRRAWPRIWWNYHKQLARSLVPRKTHTLPVDPERKGTPTFSLRHLDADRVAALAARGRAAGATLNDLMIAAYLRAQMDLGAWDGESTFRLSTTVDNRRYLPGKRGAGIGNLSTIEFYSFGNRLGATFDQTLAVVTARTRARKASWLGLNAYVGLLPLFRRLPFAWQKRLFRAVLERGIRRGNAANGLTNLGPIREEDVTFDRPPRQAFILPPSAVPPMFVAALSGYAGTLTVSAAYYPESMSHVGADRFLDEMLRQLPD